MLGLLTSEVLFEEIDLVVLLDALFGVGDQVSGGVGVRKKGISHQLLLILGDLKGLSGIVLLGPTTNGVLNTAVGCGDALCVDLRKKMGLVTVSKEGLVRLTEW